MLAMKYLISMKKLTIEEITSVLDKSDVLSLDIFKRPEGLYWAVDHIDNVYHIIALIDGNDEEIEDISSDENIKQIQKNRDLANPFKYEDFSQAIESLKERRNAREILGNNG